MPVLSKGSTGSTEGRGIPFCYSGGYLYQGKVFGYAEGYPGKGKLRRYKANGTLMMYVSSAIMDALEQSTEFTRKIEMTQIAGGGGN